MSLVHIPNDCSTRIYSVCVVYSCMCHLWRVSIKRAYRSRSYIAHSSCIISGKQTRHVFGLKQIDVYKYKPEQIESKYMKTTSVSKLPMPNLWYSQNNSLFWPYLKYTLMNSISFPIGKHKRARFPKTNWCSDVLKKTIFQQINSLDFDVIAPKTLWQKQPRNSEILCTCLGMVKPGSNLWAHRLNHGCLAWIVIHLL